MLIFKVEFSSKPENADNTISDIQFELREAEKAVTYFPKSMQLAFAYHNTHHEFISLIR